jgi:hypothetical protein
MEAEPLTIEGLAQTYPIPRGFAVVGGFLYAMFSGVHLDKLVPLTREQTENAVRVLKSIPREKSDIRDQAAVGAYLQNLRNLAYGQFCADEGSLVLRTVTHLDGCELLWDTAKHFNNIAPELKQRPLTEILGKNDTFFSEDRQKSLFDAHTQGCVINMFETRVDSDALGDHKIKATIRSPRAQPIPGNDVVWEPTPVTAAADVTKQRQMAAGQFQRTTPKRPAARTGQQQMRGQNTLHLQHS